MYVWITLDNAECVPFLHWADHKTPFPAHQREQQLTTSNNNLQYNNAILHMSKWLPFKNTAMLPCEFTVMISCCEFIIVWCRCFYVWWHEFYIDVTDISNVLHSYLIIVARSLAPHTTSCLFCLLHSSIEDCIIQPWLSLRCVCSDLA